MIVLFDVDGTLVTTGGAGRRAYEAAFAAEFGEGHGLLEFSFSGLTDPRIVRRGLEAAGDAVDDARRETLFERYLERLPGALEASTGYTLHPGVCDLLDTLAARDDLAIGLGTGNLESGARLKLEPADLNHYFAFGGFGSDAEERWKILREGARRGASRLGRPRKELRVVVIGDTPRDVRAARKLGAECVAVNTGSTAESEIRDAEPDHFVEDLRDPTVLELLGLP